MSNRIRVLHFPGPGIPHRSIMVDRDDDKELSALVGGGYLEMLTITDDGLALMCDQDGGRKNLQVNFTALKGIAVRGPAFFFKRNDPDMVSLTEDDIARIVELVTPFPAHKAHRTNQDASSGVTFCTETFPLMRESRPVRGGYLNTYWCKKHDWTWEEIMRTEPD
jgi:hypothetical protein